MGELELEQDGDRIYGSLDSNSGKVSVIGSGTGKVISGSWRAEESRGMPGEATNGQFRMVMQDDGQSFAGHRTFARQTFRMPGQDNRFRAPDPSQQWMGRRLSR
jgi:hypothetical protein